MTGLTDFITEANWEDLLTTWYVLVDDAYPALQAHYGPWRRRGPEPDFSDSEVITVSLLIDTLFHGHEALGLAFLRQYHAELFPALPPNGQFNHRRRQLGLLMEHLRQYLTYRYGLLDPQNAYRLIDSAPIPACTYGRARRNRTLVGHEYFGVMPARGAKLYGMRLYLSATHGQVVDQWLLAPAGVADSQVMGALFEDAHGLIAFGDNAFQDPAVTDPLWERRQVRVWALPRRDSRQPWPKAFRQWVGRLRLRVETALSVLATVFRIEQPGSRSLSGLVARVSTRMLAYTLCFIVAPILARMGS